MSKSKLILNQSKHRRFKKIFGTITDHFYVVTPNGRMYPKNLLRKAFEECNVTSSIELKHE